MPGRIHLSVPHMGSDELRLVQETFASNWLSTVGPQLEAFDREMSERLGGGVHTVAVASGTAALHLVLRASGVQAGDRVAVSTLTFAGSVFPILYVGATPVLVDSEDHSGNIDPDLVEEYFRAASRRGTLPRALIAVHLYGQHADLDRLAALCEEHGVVLIEDAAESLGATYRGRQTATTAPFSILSFNGNKIITTTGGGMAVAKDPAMAARIRKWSTQAREPAVDYLHCEMGYNYRLSNVLAAIGRGQLGVLDDRVAARRRVFERYAEAFGGLQGVTMQPEASWGTHTRWLSVLFLDPAVIPVDPFGIVQALGAQDIEVRPVWRPMHLQPLFAGAERVGGAVAERLFRTGLCLPSSSSLTERDQNRVIDALRAAIAPVAEAAWQG